ncbi:hypothetical protein ACTI_62860 [Actinoplanes sp. OR16]|nr:hypothetical protein ACTI_62860 [Actinoplanes sp. OR16]
MVLAAGDTSGVNSNEDIEQRVAALEAKVAFIQQDVIGARALAAGADHEVSEVRAELRGHTRVLEALRQTQLEHYTELKSDLGHLRADVGEIKVGITRIVRLLENAGGEPSA